MERYTRILDLYKRLIQNNCHIIFDKGALLKDNRNDKNILQLQFLNIGNKQVKAVYVAIECLSIEDELLETVDFEYLDLAVKYGDVFGSNIPVVLNNSSCRKFNFGIRKILYEDSSVMLDGKMEELPVYDDLNDLGNLKDQFVREVKAIDYRIKPLIKPTESQWCWYCTCGSVNYCENKKCGKCKVNKEKLFSILGSEYLSEQNKMFLDNEENKRKIEAENIIKRKRKIKRVVITISSILMICVTIFLLSIYYVIPTIKRKQILNTMKQGYYSEGYKEFNNFRSTPLTFNDIKLAYDLGNECMKNEEYETAKKLFSFTREYKDGDELYRNVAYLYGMECNDNKEYEKAINALEDSDGYNDAQEQLKQITYLYGLQCHYDKNYEKAIDYFKKAKKLGNTYADMRIKNAKYAYVIENMDRWNDTTRRYLLDLKKDNYTNAEKIYNDLYN